MGTCLRDDEEAPAVLVNGGGRSPYVLICEHASNRLPKTLGTLGLPESGLERHIAWDIDRKSTRLNSSHIQKSRMPSSA